MAKLKTSKSIIVRKATVVMGLTWGQIGCIFIGMVISFVLFMVLAQTEFGSKGGCILAVVPGVPFFLTAVAKLNGMTIREYAAAVLRYYTAPKKRIHKNTNESYVLLVERRKESGNVK